MIQIIWTPKLADELSREHNLPRFFRIVIVHQITGAPASEDEYFNLWNPLDVCLKQKSYRPLYPWDRIRYYTDYFEGLTPDENNNLAKIIRKAQGRH